MWLAIVGLFCDVVLFCCVWYFRWRMKQEIRQRDILLYIVLEAERKLRQHKLIGEKPGYWIREEQDGHS
jgi:hypothetical protein